MLTIVLLSGMEGTGCQPIPALIAKMHDTRHPVRGGKAFGSSANNKTKTAEHAP